MRLKTWQTTGATRIVYIYASGFISGGVPTRRFLDHKTSNQRRPALTYPELS